GGERCWCRATSFRLPALEVSGCEARREDEPECEQHREQHECLRRAPAARCRDRLRKRARLPCRPVPGRRSTGRGALAGVRVTHGVTGRRGSPVRIGTARRRGCSIAATAVATTTAPARARRCGLPAGATGPGLTLNRTSLVAVGRERRVVGKQVGA